jgi:hypothetical protein
MALFFLRRSARARPSRPASSGTPVSYLLFTSSLSLISVISSHQCDQWFSPPALPENKTRIIVCFFFCVLLISWWLTAQCVVAVLNGTSGAPAASAGRHRSPPYGVGTSGVWSGSLSAGAMPATPFQGWPKKFLLIVYRAPGSLLFAVCRSIRGPGWKMFWSPALCLRFTERKAGCGRKRKMCA